MSKREDKSEWAVGGGVLAGVGAGMFFLPHEPMAFVACLLIGIGAGLVITSILAAKK
jgi:F0F1-type ATP synthase assembly protein I